MRSKHHLKPPGPLNSPFNGMPTWAFSDEDSSNPAMHGFVGMNVVGPGFRHLTTIEKKHERGREDDPKER